MITHKNVITYTTWFVNAFKITKDNIFGNQTPFNFSMSVTDFYGALLSGAELDIIPKSYFSFPIQLVTYLNDRHINTIYWVLSVFSIIKYYQLFDYILPKYLKLVLFAGEVMQLPWLNYFRSKIPEAEYANLFGPTETTDICTYYVVNRDFKDNDVLPIGKTCEGLDVFLLNDQHQRIKEPNQKGEMYVSGPFVSEGYYQDKVRTAKTFVSDPSKETPCICYKSGDCCYYNDLGGLMFASRIDFQIKHLGYRIELGEIESNVLMIDGIMNAVCVYDSITDSIILFYTGKTKEDALNKELSSKVPHYMMPAVIKKEAILKTNPNGKIDRKYYQSNINTLINE
ncbi:MAG: AMP-binding protein [Bacilli bacterium]